MTEKIIPDGYKLVAVKGLDELVYWLERCKDKGHLENCADLIEPFEAFEYRNISEEAVIATHEAKAEPFGYFRAEPFGWTDCAADDEGAIALYERPAAPAVPQGWKLVPVEPTPEMLAAVSWPGCARTDWSHMLAATPAAPSQPAVPQGAEMPLSMAQFGGLVDLAREHMVDNTFVYKATSSTGDTCHFGVEAAAKAWAKGGTVEAIKVREFKLHTTPAAPSQPVTLTDEELEECFRRTHEQTNTAYVPIARFPVGWRLYGRQVIAALREKEGGV